MVHKSLFSIFFAGFLFTACSEKAPEPPPAPPAETPPPVAAAPVAEPEEAAGAPGSIKVTIQFEGAALEPKALERKQDTFCAKTKAVDESLLVNKNNTLKNVVVRLTKGVKGPFEPATTPVVVDQKACMYRPRVQTARVGQPVQIANGDSTLHNVHTYVGEAQKTVFNQAMPPNSKPMDKTFTDGGEIVTFRCDVHPWMAGFVSVADHPFQAVTGDDGSVTLTNVPSKKYTLESWHEKLGFQQTTVKVEPGQTAEVTLIYKAAQAG